MGRRGGRSQTGQTIPDGKDILNTLFRVEKRVPCRSNIDFNVASARRLAGRVGGGLLGPDLRSATSVQVQRVIPPLVV